MTITNPTLTILEVFRELGVDPQYPKPFNDEIEKASEKALTPIRPITLDDILNISCTVFNTTPQMILSDCRDSLKCTIPRQFCMFFACILTDISLSKIGIFYNRDHATVMHSIKTIFRFTDLRDKMVYPFYLSFLNELLKIGVSNDIVTERIEIRRRDGNKERGNYPPVSIFNVFRGNER